MASRKTKFVVGIFVTMGFIIAASVIVWLGASNVFEKGRKYVAFFDESIQGLDKDSSVKYRGVLIGRVFSVDLAPDSTLIEVVMRIDADIRMESDMFAQLKSVGITGLMFIEIDRKQKDEEIKQLPIRFKTEYPIILTKPSGMKMFMDSMSELRDLITQFDSAGLSEKLKYSIDVLNRTLDNANSTIEGINGIVSENRNELNEAFTSLRNSIKNADLFLQEGADLLRRSNANMTGIQSHLLITLQNLEKASENLNSFINIISDQPSQLIFGEPPPSRIIEQERR